MADLVVDVQDGDRYLCLVLRERDLEWRGLLERLLDLVLDLVCRRAGGAGGGGTGRSTGAAGVEGIDR